MIPVTDNLTVRSVAKKAVITVVSRGLAADAKGPRRNDSHAD